MSNHVLIKDHQWLSSNCYEFDFFNVRDRFDFGFRVSFLCLKINKTQTLHILTPSIRSIRFLKHGKRLEKGKEKTTKQQKDQVKVTLSSFPNAFSVRLWLGLGPISHEIYYTLANGTNNFKFLLEFRDVSQLNMCTFRFL